MAENDSAEWYMPPSSKVLPAALFHPARAGGLWVVEGTGGIRATLHAGPVRGFWSVSGLSVVCRSGWIIVVSMGLELSH